MVVTYQPGKYTYLVPQTDTENDSIIKNPIPNFLWVNCEGSKRLPVYVRLPDWSTELPTLDELPREVVANCVALIQQANPKKAIKQLTYCQLTTTMSFARIPKQIARAVKPSPTDEQSLMATKKTVDMDFEMEQQRFLASKSELNTQKFRSNQKSERENAKMYRELAEQNRRGYTDLFDDNSLQTSSNQNRNEDWEDDFM